MVTLFRESREDLFGRGEGFDLFADNIYTAVVGGVEFEDHLAHVFGAVDVPGEGEDGGCFACARRAVEEKVGESLHHESAWCFLEGLLD
jgi:hypothetical protein